MTIDAGKATELKKALADDTATLTADVAEGDTDSDEPVAESVAEGDVQNVRVRAPKGSSGTKSKTFTHRESASEGFEEASEGLDGPPPWHPGYMPPQMTHPNGPWGDTPMQSRAGS